MSSKTIPTPYMWSYQPQSGHAAGASQDYSSRMNWLSAGPSMISQVNEINRLRNDILLRQALITQTPRSVQNPRIWPAQHLIQQLPREMTVELPRNTQLEQRMTDSGIQLAGGGVGDLPLWTISTDNINGKGIQLATEFPTASSLRPDGVFQLAGGSRSSFGPTEALLKLQTSSSLPRSGGVGRRQFVAEFVPQVYFNPFSGPPDSFPDEFISNFNYQTSTIAGYD
ncbi:pVIII [bottlenose dolphin adenovirus 2]|uniref:Pre-hexon-linking protein VIII n=1 Tax=bottlenose dolphin adenovirus 2 TaxID=2849592 RepID=A0A0M4M5J1_9ADEN|nr:pVIII [Bottlenose dolphin adenovirus 1]ALE15310.1 pVIII [Bottlenose dolphin adenovirus 1]